MPQVNTVTVGHANKPVPHETLTPISNILQRGDSVLLGEYSDWARENSTRVFDWDVRTTGHRDRATSRAIRFYKTALGRQDICVVFRHRNWVWHRPDEGWTIYVDRRGPSLHVAQGATPEEAYDAFKRFSQHVDKFFELRPTAVLAASFDPIGKVAETRGRSFAGLEYTDDGPRGSLEYTDDGPR